MGDSVCKEVHFMGDSVCKEVHFMCDIVYVRKCTSWVI